MYIIHMDACVYKYCALGTGAKKWQGSLWMVCICLIVVDVTSVVQYIMAHMNQMFKVKLDKLMCL